MPTPLHEPHKIKTVRRLVFPTLEERKSALARVGFNVFHLTPAQVSFEMASLGTGAMSQEQLSGLYVGDEAYAGAVNFERLVGVVRDVLGHTYVCPTHNALGSIKLVFTTMIPVGSVVLTNARSMMDVLEPRGVQVLDARARHPVFTGDLDLEAAEKLFAAGGVSMILLQTFADGQHPFSLENLSAARALADRHGIRLFLDVSRVLENAWYIQKHEKGQSGSSIAKLTRQIAKLAHVIHLDAAQDPRGNVGGFIATDNPNDHELLMNEVVVYEGLHTYGGMAGRTMEALARGLGEMTNEEQVHWIMHQTERFTERLRAGGVPLERGCDGAYILAAEFLPHLEAHHQDAFSAALYQTCGVKALADGLVGRDALVPVQIPRLALTNDQLDQVADAIIALHRQRDLVRGLEPTSTGRWRDQLRYRAAFADLACFEFTCTPHLVHTFEYVGRLSREERVRAMEEAGFNTFLLRSTDVTIDLLTDSGTAAMSTDQWAAWEAARPSPSTSTEYKAFYDAVYDLFGYKYIIPTHQGRAAEFILSQTCIRKGQIVPGNMYFTTTRQHQEMAGATFIDVIVDEAHDSQSLCEWKGNIDLTKLDRIVQEHGAQKIAYIKYEFSVNMAGGQPVSMDNLRDTAAYCQARGIKIMFDGTRLAENAYMIQKKDPRYAKVPIRDILREMLTYGDGCTISGKKDFIINMGGMLAFRDDADLAARAEELLRVWEGGIRDGGLPAADLAAIAQGIEEMVDDRYIRARVEQTRYLGQLLMEAGIPIVTPPGSFAINLDAKRFLPHLEQEQCPAQRLAAEVYIETGVRSMERGIVSAGRKKTGENYHPALEMVRLTIPRRVYTNDHMRAIAEGIARLYARRHEIKGLRFVYEPKALRFFQGRFESL
jgi:tyrosine phenol-lyase